MQHILYYGAQPDSLFTFMNCNEIALRAFFLPLFNPLPAKSSYINFHPPEVVSRHRDPQLQVGEKYSYLFNLRPNICKSSFHSK